MIDIVTSAEGEDLAVLDTDVPRAKNILSVQLGSLEYAPTMGIDLAYFLSEKFSFQNESFKAYLVQRLADFGVNVSSVSESLEAFFLKLTFNISDSNAGNDGLIAR